MSNPIVHFEIGCRDREKQSEFYGKLFEWKMEPNPMVTMIRTGGDVGGHLNQLGHEPHNYTIFYVGVDSCEAALAQAVSLGGKKLVGPVAVPGSETWFAWIADPEGNMIGLYSEKKK